MKKILILLATLCLFPGARVGAAVPEYLHYQGRALTASGEVLGKGNPVTYQVTIRVWNHPSSILPANLLYSEQQAVTIAEGEFSLFIGKGANTEGTTLGFAETDKGPGSVSISNAVAGTSCYFGITIANGQEIAPRQRWVSTAYAMRAAMADTIEGGLTPAMLAPGAVTSEKLSTGAIATNKLASDSVNSDAIADGTVTSAKIATGAVDSAAIADFFGVAGADIAAAAITSDKLQTGVVPTEGILDGTIATADLADSAVTTAKFADGAVTAAKFATGSITPAKLAGAGAFIPVGMAFIPGGTYTQGNSMAADTNIPDAAPVSTTVSPFYMDVNLVTWGKWQAVYYWATANSYTFTNAGLGRFPIHPVHTISWYDAVKWCNARSQQEGLTPVYYTDTAQTTVYKTGNVNVTNAMVKWTANGYRLPTEAEWERAARGGLSGQRFPWGNTITTNLANYSGYTGFVYDLGPDGPSPMANQAATPYTSPVGSYAPNGYGLYDMAGNSSQWCWDWYGTPYAGGADPRGASTSAWRIHRTYGGSAGSHVVRIAYRHSAYPTYVSTSNGFRTVRSIP